MSRGNVRTDISRWRDSLALFHLAVKRHLFGQLGLEAPLPDEVPRAPKKLSHDGLLRGVEHFVNGEDEPVEFLTFRG